MKKGFTLLEILVSIGIISILLAIGIPTFQMLQHNSSLKNYTKEIVSVLKKSQNDAMTAQDGTAHGVYFEDNQYSICRDDCSPATFSGSFEINNGIKIISGADAAIVFNRLSGETSDNTDKEVVIGFPHGDQKTIKVNNDGKIFIL